MWLSLKFTKTYVYLSSGKKDDLNNERKKFHQRKSLYVSFLKLQYMWNIKTSEKTKEVRGLSFWSEYKIVKVK